MSAHLGSGDLADGLAHFWSNAHSDDPEREASRGEGRRARTHRAIWAARRVHQHWFNAAVAKSAEDVGSIIDFIGDLDPGNFHITCTSKLFVVHPEIVNPNSLAEMQHSGQTRLAPIGPPAITGDAWLHAAGEAAGRAAGFEEPLQGLSVKAQADIELNRRSLHPAAKESQGHVEDELRDTFRQDRRYARSSSQVTPAIFAMQIQGKRFNETTATIEELDLPPGDLELPTGAASEAAQRERAAAAAQAAQSRVEPGEPETFGPKAWSGSQRRSTAGNVFRSGSAR